MDECHVVECAFTSPRVSMRARMLVKSVSSVSWSGSVVGRGGMYRFTMCMFLFCIR